MSPVTLRCAQSWTRCSAPRKRCAELCPEPEHQEPGTVGSVSQNHGASLTEVLGDHQHRREAGAREAECASPLGSLSRGPIINSEHQWTSPLKGGRRLRRPLE